MEFSKLPIHRDIQAILTENMKEGRVPHAQFFLGEDGSANLAMAVAYANELLQSEKDMFGNGDDRAARFEHPDLHIVFPMVQATSKTSETLLPQFREAYGENPFISFEQWMAAVEDGKKTALISVHESRKMIKKLELRAYEGGRKVLIIWMPEMMNIDCANKLLKLIEEPPSGSVLLLVGSDFDAMLPTIRSRVQLIRFKPLKESELISVLQSRLPGADAEEVRKAAQRAEGNLAKGIKHLTQESELDTMELKIQDWMRLCYKRAVIEFMEWVDDVSKEGKEYQKQLLSKTLEIFRMAFRKNFIAVPVKSDEQMEAFTQKFSPFVNQYNVSELMNSFDKAYSDIDRNGNPRIIFTDLSFQITRALRNPVSDN